MEYLLNVNENSYMTYSVKDIKELSDYTCRGNWTDVLYLLESDKRLVSRYRLPKINGMANLYTPLHQAAFLKAPKEVFEKLLSLGASKTLKTADGRTAYDIAKQKGLYVDTLKLIEVPEEITAKVEEIQKMEKGLHDQTLPQLSYFYEFGSFSYHVPGIYGEFNVEEHAEGIQTSGWCRVAGGRGQRYDTLLWRKNYRLL